MLEREKTQKSARFFSIFATCEFYATARARSAIRYWHFGVDRQDCTRGFPFRLIRRSMIGIDEIAAAEDRLDQGLPVELAAPGLYRSHQPLISLPGGDRCHFLFRPVLDLLVRIAAAVNRSLGSLAYRLCIRYHLQSRDRVIRNCPIGTLQELR